MSNSESISPQTSGSASSSPISFDVIRGEFTTEKLQTIFNQAGVTAVSKEEWNNHAKTLPRATADQLKRIQNLIEKSKT